MSRPRRATRCVEQMYACFALPPGGGSLLVSENDRWNRSFVLLCLVCCRRVAGRQNSVQHASTLLRFSGARVAALPSARHTPAATMAEQGKQDIVRKLIHIFLDVPHDIFVNFTRSIERGTRHRNAHSVSKNPTPNPRALFPFGPESPSPGAIADGHLPRFGPSTSAHPPAPSLTSSPALSLFRAKTTRTPKQPPARLRSSSGSPSSASCSWSPSCTKRRRS